MRFCLPTTVTVDAETKRGADGRLVYKLNGPATASYIEFMDLLDRLFYNRTYYFTSDVDECGIRMRQNLSDAETAYVSYFKNLTYYTVPVPVMISKTSIVTGSNVDAVQSGDSASVMENFSRFQLDIYLWSICLIMLLLFIIASKIFLFLDLKRHLKHQSIRRLEKSKNSSLLYCAAGKIIQHAWNTFFGSSNAFRWLGYLFTLFSFLLITFFLCSYSTSKVIVEEPFIVKNYQELLDTERSIPMFYDLVSQVSHQFRDAPVQSIKHKVWLKLHQLCDNPSDYIFTENSENPRENMLHVVDKLEKDKSVFITSSLMANLLRTFGCGSSSDGSSGDREEFWRLIIVSDPHEHEDIFGWPLSKRLEGDKMFPRKVNRLVYSGILVDYFNKQTDASAFASSLAGTNPHHLYRAMRICSDDYKLETDQFFKAVALDHYRTAFKLYLCAFTASSFILTLEILYKYCLFECFQRS